MLPPCGKSSSHQWRARSHYNAWTSWADQAVLSATVSPGQSLCGWDNLPGTPGGGLRIKEEIIHSEEETFPVNQLEGFLKESDRTLVSGGALSCGWRSQTCGRCPLCTSRASPRAPTSSPTPLVLGSYRWPGDTLSPQSADRWNRLHSGFRVLVESLSQSEVNSAEVKISPLTQLLFAYLNQFWYIIRWWLETM